MPDADRAEPRRGAAEALGRALSRHPVVLVVGPGGVGKTTLARAAFDGGGPFVELARDDRARAEATADPAGFVRRLAPGTVLDDVHLVPGLLAELDALCDRLRSPGHLLATTSLLGLRQASRVGGLRRLPRLTLSSLTQGERRRRIGRLIPALFAGDPAQWPVEALALPDYVERALEGGLPGLHPLADPDARRARYIDAVQALLGAGGPADAPGLAQVFELAVGRPTARITFDRDAGELGLSPSTLANRLELLEALGLLRLSPAWTRFRRSADSVRAYVHDPGYLHAVGLLQPVTVGALRQVPAGAGHPPRPLSAALVLRTLAAHELHAQNGWSRHPVDISFWRSKPSQYDIDFLLEDRNGAVVPIAVSDSPAPGAEEFAGIDAFRRRHPRAYRRGIVLYPGDAVRALGDNRWAVPLSVLWTVAEEAAPLDVASLDAELEAAASALKALVLRPAATNPQLAEHRARICAAMQSSLEPRLERIGLVLGSLGLGVRPVAPLTVPQADDDPLPPPWLPGLHQGVIDRVNRPQLAVVSGLEISSPQADPSGSGRWIAYISAVVGADEVLHWQAGHAVVAATDTAGGQQPPAAHIGVAGPLRGPLDDIDDVLIDQLCAALAASLPDALAALTPAA